MPRRTTLFGDLSSTFSGTDPTTVIIAVVVAIALPLIFMYFLNKISAHGHSTAAPPGLRSRNHPRHNRGRVHHRPSHHYKERSETKSNDGGGDSPAPTPPPPFYFDHVYNMLHSNQCDEGHIKLADDLRVGGGGDTIRMCGVPSNRSDNNVTEITSAIDNCPGGYETAAHWWHHKGNWRSEPADLRSGAGGKTIRMCFKRGTPGADGIRVYSTGGQRNPGCNFSNSKRINGDRNLMDDTGSGTSYWNICAKK